MRENMWRGIVWVLCEILQKDASTWRESTPSFWSKTQRRRWKICYWLLSVMSKEWDSFSPDMDLLVQAHNTHEINHHFQWWCYCCALWVYMKTTDKSNYIKGVTPMTVVVLLFRFRGGGFTFARCLNYILP